MNGIVFIETRDLPGLANIFEDHIKFVPELDPVVICSKQNAYQFKGFKKIIIDHPKNIREYNLMITNSTFWEKLQFKKVLICEHESGILRKGIEEFYEWDYVGAPWWFQNYGGNGGFSFRNVKVMGDICRIKKYYISDGNEDVYFCNVMRNYNMKLAPKNVCERFSVETVFKLGTFGYHLGSDAKRMLSNAEINKIKCQNMTLT